MKIGIHLPQFGSRAGRDAVLRVARHAEDAGLASVWVGDHLAFPVLSSSPYPYTKDGSFPLPEDGAFLEALTTLALVAGATERVALGTSVLVAPVRDTITLARQVGTLAHLAPGRVILGVGSGWLAEEFSVLHRDFADRGRVLDEQLQALRGLWTTPAFAFNGTHVRFPAVHVEPRPDPVPPIWVGGNSTAALRRAGRLGDAWHAAGVPTTDTLAASMETVRSAAEKEGRDPGDIGLTARSGVRDGLAGWEALERRIDRLCAAGCSDLLVDPGDRPVDEVLRVCDRLAVVR